MGLVRNGDEAHREAAEQQQQQQQQQQYGGRGEELKLLKESICVYVYMFSCKEERVTGRKRGKWDRRIGKGGEN